MEPAVYTVGTLIEHDSKYPVASCCNLVHLTYLRRIYSGRFLDQNMQSVLQCVYRISRMPVMRCSDQYGITFSGTDQFLSIREYTDVSGEMLFGVFKSLLTDIRYCGQTKSRDISL